MSGSAPVLTRTLLERLPKAELHCHLDGSLRPATLLELGREYHAPMPRDDAEALREFMIVKDARTLEDYLRRFEITLSVMQRADALERIAFELAEDAAREGVRYLETRFAPVLNIRQGLSLGETIEAARRGLERAERAYGIVGRLIICGLRTLDPAVSLELARLAVAYQHQGVVAFDLAGGEMGHPAALHAEAFAHAHAHGLACTCHAGEGDGPDSIRQALHVCGAQRIGHATRLGEDEALTREAADRHIPLEICLTSNVQTHAAASYEAHPARQYIDRGMTVILNTDNRLMSGVNLVDEYEHAVRQLHCSFDELARIALAGFQSAFVDEDTRGRLVSEATAAIEQLRSGQ
ncbi:MAG: adenosine deaminase [Gemmatimonadaceae bacterium]